MDIINAMSYMTLLHMELNKVEYIGARQDLF